MASACNPENAQKTLASTEETLKVAVNLCEQEKQRLLERKVESIQNVRQVRKEIDEKLDELEQASVAEIENKYEEMISKIEEEIIKFRDAKGNVVSAKDKLASADNNTSQIFVGTKTGQSSAMEAEGILKKKKITCYYEDITVKGDPKLKEILEQIKYLGQVTPSCLLKGMEKYSVKDQTDSKDCRITSYHVLEDGTIILADFNNKKLKRLDRSTYSIRDHYTLPVFPWQMCATNNQEVAVSTMTPEIIFISLGKQMTEKSVTKTDFDCYALAYANDKLYISDECKSVYIYSVSGQKLNKFKMTGLVQSWMPGARSNSYDTSIESLAVNVDGSRIYVAHSKKGLTVLNSNGKVVWKFNEQAEGVHITRTGTVLVCGYYSGNILKLSPDGKNIGEVLNGVHSCHTVCCNQQMSKMIVGTLSGNDMQVYDLV